MTISSNNKIVIAIAAVCLIILGIVVASQAITTYYAHDTFESYCAWRGLVVESKSTDFGYCKNPKTGKLSKIVLYKGRWYLDGDLPCGFLCF